MNPRKPKPAAPAEPTNPGLLTALLMALALGGTAPPLLPEPVSRRDQLAARRQGFADDENGFTDAVVNIGIGLLVLAVVWVIVNQKVAEGKTACGVDYSGDSAAIAKCKGSYDTNLTIGGIAVLMAILGGVAIKKKVSG